MGKARPSYSEIARRLGISRERVRQIASHTSKSRPKKKPAPGDPEAILTITEVATLLNIHINTVKRWSDAGILTAYRIGPRRDRRFKRRDIDNLLQESLARN